MTPTREQVIEWAKASGFETRRDEVQVAGVDVSRSIERLCALAYSAGRAQGLREARDVCNEVGNGYQIAGMSVAMECAAAIQQLEGK